ncbi:MAG TPA: hypothetical protein VN030_01860 [Cellvibrio sp.]|nr:hypothetical protein [Cellvibrio sp.]
MKELQQKNTWKGDGGHQVTPEKLPAENYLRRHRGVIAEFFGPSNN